MCGRNLWGRQAFKSIALIVSDRPSDWLGESDYKTQCKSTADRFYKGLCPMQTALTYCQRVYTLVSQSVSFLVVRQKSQRNCNVKEK